MDNVLDSLDLVPVIPVCRVMLGLAAALMLVTLWLVRQKRQRLAGILAVTGLILGVAAAARLATWKELSPIQKCLESTGYYKQVAIKRIATIIHQQYPQHKVVALFAPSTSMADPYCGLSNLTDALGPQTKLVGVNIKADKGSLNELVAERKRQGENIQADVAVQFINDFFLDWYCGRNFKAAVAAAGLSGDIVVVSFAGLPSRGLEEIKAAGLPILVVSGNVPQVVDRVSDGTVKAVILQRPGAAKETRIYHNQDTGFARHWFLLTKETVDDAQKIPKLLEADVALLDQAPASTAPAKKN
jgi:hypothetical protein